MRRYEDIPACGTVYAQTSEENFTGHVVAVTAGDTMDVRVGGGGDGSTVTVRLHGVECPTSPRAFRETATRFTSRLVLDTDVRVEVRGRASDNVVYGEVFPRTGGESVNFTLARDGLATWASDYAAQRTDLEDAESYAKTAGRGLWGAEDGSNIILPPSAAEAIRRDAAAKQAEAARASEAVRDAKPSGADESRTVAAPSPEPVIAEPAIVAPTPSAAVLAPEPKPMPVAVSAVTDRSGPAILVPLVGGVAVAVLTSLSLLAYGVAHGLSFRPARLLCQLFFTFVAGGLGATAFALPAANWQEMLAAGSVPIPFIMALIGPLLSVLLLFVGGGIVREAARLQGAAVDPRLAELGSVKLHGTAQAMTADRIHSEIGQIRGLYVREVTSRYTAETKNGKRLSSPRWVKVRDTAGAVDFELFSSAGDGTGSALILAAQDEETPQALAPARWIPYHVARFYNEVPSNSWFTTSYEGDTRTEIFFVPNGATLTIWGGFHGPAPSPPASDDTVEPVPRIASDGVMGTLLICDGPEARAYAGKGGSSLMFGFGYLLLGIVCAGGTVWGISAGGDIARQTATASLGVGLAVLLFLAIRHGVMLARNADREEREGETDPLRRPAIAVWERYGRHFPGVLIAPVVSE